MDLLSAGNCVRKSSFFCFVFCWLVSTYDTCCFPGLVFCRLLILTYKLQLCCNAYSNVFSILHFCLKNSEIIVLLTLLFGLRYGKSSSAAIYYSFSLTYYPCYPCRQSFWLFPLNHKFMDCRLRFYIAITQFSFRWLSNVFLVS